MIKPLKSSRTGLLAGVFDPVHIGHLFMAYLAMEAANLDRVWFVLLTYLHTRQRESPLLSPRQHVGDGAKRGTQFVLMELEREARPTYSYETIFVSKTRTW